MGVLNWNWKRTRRDPTIWTVLFQVVLTYALLSGALVQCSDTAEVTDSPEAVTFEPEIKIDQTTIVDTNDTAQENLDEPNGEGTRETRSLNHIGKLLFGGTYVMVQLGHMPPDHPLVKYPNPIQTSGIASTNNGVIAAVPGMNGGPPIIGAFGPYNVHTPGVPYSPYARHPHFKPRTPMDSTIRQSYAQLMDKAKRLHPATNLGKIHPRHRHKYRPQPIPSHLMDINPPEEFSSHNEVEEAEVELANMFSDGMTDSFPSPVPYTRATTRYKSCGEGCTQYEYDRSDGDASYGQYSHTDYVEMEEPPPEMVEDPTASRYHKSDEAKLLVATPTPFTPTPTNDRSYSRLTTKETPSSPEKMDQAGSISLMTKTIMPAMFPSIYKKGGGGLTGSRRSSSSTRRPTTKTTTKTARPPTYAPLPSHIYNEKTKQFYYRRKNPAFEPPFPEEAVMASPQNFPPSVFQPKPFIMNGNSVGHSNGVVAAMPFGYSETSGPSPAPTVRHKGSRPPKHGHRNKAYQLLSESEHSYPPTQSSSSTSTTRGEHKYYYGEPRPSSTVTTHYSSKTPSHSYEGRHSTKGPSHHHHHSRDHYSHSGHAHSHSSHGRNPSSYNSDLSTSPSEKNQQTSVVSGSGSGNGNGNGRGWSNDERGSNTHAHSHDQNSNTQGHSRSHHHSHSGDSSKYSNKGSKSQSHSYPSRENSGTMKDSTRRRQSDNEHNKSDSYYRTTTSAHVRRNDYSENNRDSGKNYSRNENNKNEEQSEENYKKSGPPYPTSSYKGDKNTDRDRASSDSDESSPATPLYHPPPTSFPKTKTTPTYYASQSPSPSSTPPVASNYVYQTPPVGQSARYQQHSGYSGSNGGGPQGHPYPPQYYNQQPSNGQGANGSPAYNYNRLQASPSTPSPSVIYSRFQPGDQQRRYDQSDHSNNNQHGNHNQYSNYNQHGSYNQHGNYNQQGNHNQHGNQNQHSNYNEHSNNNQRNNHNSQFKYQNFNDEDGRAGPGYSHSGFAKKILSTAAPNTNDRNSNNHANVDSHVPSAAPVFKHHQNFSAHPAHRNVNGHSRQRLSSRYKAGTPTGAATSPLSPVVSAPESGKHNTIPLSGNQTIYLNVFGDARNKGEQSQVRSSSENNRREFQNGNENKHQHHNNYRTSSPRRRINYTLDLTSGQFQAHPPLNRKLRYLDDQIAAGSEIVEVIENTDRIENVNPELKSNGQDVSNFEQNQHHVENINENQPENSNQNSSPNPIQNLNQNQPPNSVENFNQNQPINPIQNLNQNQPPNPNHDFNQNQQSNPIQNVNQNQPPNSFENFDQNQLSNTDQNFDQNQPLNQMQNFDQNQPPIPIQNINQNQPPNSNENFNQNQQSNPIQNINQNQPPNSFENFNQNQPSNTDQNFDQNQPPIPIQNINQNQPPNSNENFNQNQQSNPIQNLNSNENQPPNIIIPTQPENVSNQNQNQHQNLNVMQTDEQPGVENNGDSGTDLGAGTLSGSSEGLRLLEDLEGFGLSLFS